MAVLEVGKDKTYSTIPAAIAKSSDNDEIRIYPGFYGETFTCDKELIFTGYPKNPYDYSTYPQICNNDEIYIERNCSFSNIIFTNISFDNTDLQRICENRILSDETVQKYYRKTNEHQKKEPSFLVIQSKSSFSNCFFAGAKNYAVIVDLNRAKENLIFRDCGFYLNWKGGIDIRGIKDDAVTILENCSISYNDTGIEGGVFSLNDTKIHHNFSTGILFSDNECRMKRCDIYRNRLGIKGCGNGKAFIEETGIHTNYFEGINLSGNAEVSFNKSEILMNNNSVIMTDKSSFHASDSEFMHNEKDIFACEDGTDIVLNNCLIPSLLEKPVTELNLSVRAVNFLKNRGIIFIGELVSLNSLKDENMTSQEDIPEREIRSSLKKIGLSLKQ